MVHKEKWKHPHKCRCGTWLYGKRVELGYCSRCGPEKDANNEGGESVG